MRGLASRRGHGRPRERRVLGDSAIHERGRAARALAVAVALLTIVPAGLWWWSSRPEPPYRLAAPVGTRTLAEPLDVVFVIDESSSTGTSDPHGRRSSETAAAIRWLARYQRPGDRVGVVQFAGSPLVTLPLTRLSAAGGRAGTATAPRIGGSTDIGDGLRAANGLLAADPGRRRVIILFTDGASDVESSITTSLDRSPADAVYLVALDADGTYGSVSSFWDGQRRLTRIVRMTHASRGAIARPIAQDVLDQTGQRLA